MPSLRRKETQRLGEVTGHRPQLLAERVQVLDDGQAGAQRGDAGPAHRAEPRQRRGGGLRERTGALDELVDLLGAEAQVGGHRDALVGERAEAAHRRRQLGEEGRQLLEVLLERGLARDRGGRHLAGLLGEAGDVLALARQRLRGSRSQSTARRSSTLFCSATQVAAPCRSPAAPARRAG